MGVVYEAVDTHLHQRRTAIKVLRPDRFTAASAERFVTEGRALAAIRHPHVVTLYDALATDGLSLLIMEFVEGPTLQQRLQQGPLPAEKVRALGLQLGSALAACHARGIVHCDIKPSNIFVEGDRALLADFGIASLVGPDNSLTTDEWFGCGTPFYMSPEQRIGARPGPASDIYSLGLVLLDSLTGIGPAWPDSRMTRNLPPHDTSGALAPLIEAMLAEDPEQRPTAEAVVHWLSRPDERTRRRRIVTAALGGVAALLLVLAAIVFGPEIRATAQRGIGPPAPLADIAIGSIDTEGDLELAHRLPQLLEKNLEWFAPIALARPHDPGDRATVSARMIADGAVIRQAASLDAEFSVRSADGTLVEVLRARGSADRLQELACALTDSLIRKVFRARYVEYSSFDQCRVGDLQAANSYFRGVDAFRVGQWAAAEQQFNLALERDPGMLQAAWELMIAERFQRKDDVPILRRLLAGRDSLPPFYVALVEAQLTPDLHQRFDRYQEVVRNYQRASKSLLLYTNEAFHRGPLIGRRMSQAVDTMRKLALVDPDMNHTSVYDISIWGDIRLGNRDAAWTDYARRKRLIGPGDRYAPFQRLAIWARFNPRWAHVVQWWAFRAPDSTTRAALTELTRLGTSFDIPAMQHDLGRVLVRTGTDLNQRTVGVLAQAMSLVMQGRTMDGLALLDTAATMLSSPEMRMQQREWPVVLDALGIPVPRSRVDSAVAWLREAAAGSRLASRARWMLGLHALTVHDTVAAIHWLDQLQQSSDTSEVAARLSPLLAAHLLTSPRAALDTTKVIFLLDSVSTRLSPFTRAVTYLGRARWQRALDDPDAADRELLWHENADHVGWLTGPPQQGEVDAVLSTYTRLLRGELGTERHDPAACRHLRRVRELWRDAEPAMQPLLDRAAGAEARCR